MSLSKHIDVTFGEDPTIVTIKISGTSEPIIAGVLGTEPDSQGEINKIYLNSLITRYSKHTNYTGWTPQGVISTILTRGNKYASY